MGPGGVVVHVSHVFPSFGRLVGGRVATSKSAKGCWVGGRWTTAAAATCSTWPGQACSRQSLRQLIYPVSRRIRGRMDSNSSRTRTSSIRLALLQSKVVPAGRKEQERKRRAWHLHQRPSGGPRRIGNGRHLLCVCGDEENIVTRTRRGELYLSCSLMVMDPAYVQHGARISCCFCPPQPLVVPPQPQRGEGKRGSLAVHTHTVKHARGTAQEMQNRSRPKLWSSSPATTRQAHHSIQPAFFGLLVSSLVYY